jgi:hypothetical protein
MLDSETRADPMGPNRAHTGSVSLAEGAEAYGVSSMNPRVLHPAAAFVLSLALLLVLADAWNFGAVALSVGIFVVATATYVGHLTGMEAERSRKASPRAGGQSTVASVTRRPASRTRTRSRV